MRKKHLLTSKEEKIREAVRIKTGIDKCNGHVQTVDGVFVAGLMRSMFPSQTEFPVAVEVRRCRLRVPVLAVLGAKLNPASTRCIPLYTASDLFTACERQRNAEGDPLDHPMNPVWLATKETLNSRKFSPSKFWTMLKYSASALRNEMHMVDDQWMQWRQKVVEHLAWVKKGAAKGLAKSKKGQDSADAKITESMAEQEKLQEKLGPHKFLDLTKNLYTLKGAMPHLPFVCKLCVYKIGLDCLF